MPAYLRRLPVDEIKIDRTFVQGMVTDLGDLAIVRAINAEVSKLVQSEEGKARLVAMNTANPPPTSPEEFAQMIRRDLPAWRKIVVDTQIKPES